MNLTHILSHELFFHEGKVGKRSLSLYEGEEEINGLGEHLYGLHNQGGFLEGAIPEISKEAHPYILPCLSGWK